jgi:uncharacterized protein (TIGR02145 family)
MRYQIKITLPEFLQSWLQKVCIYNPVAHLYNSKLAGSKKSHDLQMDMRQFEWLLFTLGSGLLTGNRNTDGTFNNRTSNGNWWSSSASGATTAINRELNTGNRGANRNSNNKANGFSVRCLKDYNHGVVFY